MKIISVVSTTLLMLLSSSCLTQAAAHLHPKSSSMNPYDPQEPLCGIGKKREFHIQRGLVDESVAKNLYHDLLSVATPSDSNPFLPWPRNPIRFLGHEGEGMVQPKTNAAIRTRLQKLTHQETKETAALLVEKMKGPSYHRTTEMIGDVLPNKSIEKGGTIHLYISSSGASALKNHTDRSDILVLQLDGAKEWILCKESIFDSQEVRDKLDQGSSFWDELVDTMFCEHHTLLPGDALLLPERTVHSAKALQGTLSVHLTFQFPDFKCAEPTKKSSSFLRS